MLSRLSPALVSPLPGTYFQDHPRSQVAGWGDWGDFEILVCVIKNRDNLEPALFSNDDLNDLEHPPYKLCFTPGSLIKAARACVATIDQEKQHEGRYVFYR